MCYDLHFRRTLIWASVLQDRAGEEPTAWRPVLSTTAVRRGGDDNRGSRDAQGWGALVPSMPTPWWIDMDCFLSATKLLTPLGQGLSLTRFYRDPSLCWQLYVHAEL